MRTGRQRYVKIPTDEKEFLLLQVEECVWSDGWVMEWRFATSDDVCFSEVVTLA